MQETFHTRKHEQHVLLASLRPTLSLRSPPSRRSKPRKFFLLSTPRVQCYPPGADMSRIAARSAVVEEMLAIQEQTSTSRPVRIPIFLRKTFSPPNRGRRLTRHSTTQSCWTHLCCCPQTLLSPFHRFDRCRCPPRCCCRCRYCSCLLVASLVAGESMVANGEVRGAMLACALPHSRWQVSVKLYHPNSRLAALRRLFTLVCHKYRNRQRYCFTVLYAAVPFPPSALFGSKRVSQHLEIERVGVPLLRVRYG